MNQNYCGRASANNCQRRLWQPKVLRIFILFCVLCIYTIFCLIDNLYCPTYKLHTKIKDFTFLRILPFLFPYILFIWTITFTQLFQHVRRHLDMTSINLQAHLLLILIGEGFKFHLVIFKIKYYNYGEKISMLLVLWKTLSI